MMRRATEFLLLICFLSLSVPSVTAQATAALPAPATGSPQSTNIPYFSLRDGMDSILTLNNLAPYPTAVNVTIFNTKGQAHALAPMSLLPQSITQVDLSQVLDSRSFDSGNVEISYNGQMMQVTAQVSIFSIDKQVDIESREADVTDFGSSSLVGILSLPRPDAEGFVAITNVGPTAVTVTLTADVHEREIKVWPRQTQLVRLNDIFSGKPPLDSLIRLQDQGSPGDIIATGYVLDLKNRYSSAFWMIDPSVAGSNMLAGVHFWAGTPPKDAGFPEGTFFHSPLHLANVSRLPITAQVFVNFTQTDSSLGKETATANSAGASSKLTVKHENVGELIIPPGEVQTIDLADIARKGGSDDSMAINGLEVTYSGTSGTLIGNLTSTDASGNYSFEVPLRDPAGKDVTPGGGYPWTLQNGTDTTVDLMNATDKATWAIAEFRFPDGTTYDPDRIVLQPHQAFVLDVAQLRRSKQADIHNKLFAANQDHGQVIWSAGTIHALVGRAEEVNAAAGIGRSFSCDLTCVCPWDVDNTYMDPGSGTFAIGYTGTPFTPKETYVAIDCYANEYGPYTVGYQGFDDPTPSWTTGDTSIVSISGEYPTGYDMQLVGAGSTYAEFDWSEDTWQSDGMGDCRGTPQGYSVDAGVTSQTPTKDRLVSTLSNYAVSPTTTPACPSGTAGWFRQVQKIVVDQNGSDMAEGGQSLSEEVTITYNGLSAPTPSTGSATTNSAGYFADTYQICVSACPASGDQTDFTQTITDTPSPDWAVEYTLDANSLAYFCTGAYVNGQ